MGVVVQFPRRFTGRFTPEMRERLAQLASETPAYLPLLFGLDEKRREYYRFGDCLMVGWDDAGRLVLTDIATGYVDHGPFGSLDDAYESLRSVMRCA